MDRAIDWRSAQDLDRAGHQSRHGSGLSYRTQTRLEGIYSRLWTMVSAQAPGWTDPRRSVADAGPTMGGLRGADPAAAQRSLCLCLACRRPIEQPSVAMGTEPDHDVDTRGCNAGRTGHSRPYVDAGACEDCRKGSSDRERADRRCHRRDSRPPQYRRVRRPSLVQIRRHHVQK